MWFETPDRAVRFEIPDEWWIFSEMGKFTLSPGGYYPYATNSNDEIRIAPLSEIEPPRRNETVPLFRKYKLVPVLLAFSSPECSLPPVQVSQLPPMGRYRFRIINGCHRFYASVAAGYPNLPIALPAIPGR